MKSFWARLIYVLLFVPVSLSDTIYWVCSGRAYHMLDKLDFTLKEWK